jgi:hypothetical protein
MPRIRDLEEYKGRGPRFFYRRLIFASPVHVILHRQVTQKEGSGCDRIGIIYVLWSKPLLHSNFNLVQIIANYILGTYLIKKAYKCIKRIAAVLFCTLKACQLIIWPGFRIGS